jgi:hypothetical protein
MNEIRKYRENSISFNLNFKSWINILFHYRQKKLRHETARGLPAGLCEWGCVTFVNVKNDCFHLDIK